MRRGDGPSAREIVDADPRPRTVADEPAVQAAGEQLGTRRRPARSTPSARRSTSPWSRPWSSTAVVDLAEYPYVAADAGLLAQDTAAADFARALDLLLDDVAALRRA